MVIVEGEVGGLGVEWRVARHVDTVGGPGPGLAPGVEAAAAVHRQLIVESLGGREAGAHGLITAALTASRGQLMTLS